jgi:hypothetical protein
MKKDPNIVAEPLPPVNEICTNARMANLGNLRKELTTLHKDARKSSDAAERYRIIAEFFELIKDARYRVQSTKG